MFFHLSKIIGALITPTNFLALVILFATVLCWTRWLNFGRSLLIISGFSLAAFTVLGVGQTLVAPLENRFPAKPVLARAPDGIILLGGPIDGPLTESRDQVATFQSAERYFEFIRLMQRYPQARGIVSGGLGAISQQSRGEAYHAKRLLNELGFDTSRVMFELDSRNTEENILYSKRMADPKPGDLWLVVTSAYHMPRAVGIFRKQSWPVVPWPVDYRSHGPKGHRQWMLFGGEALDLVDTAVKEWIGLTAYHFTDRTSAWFPQNGTPPDEAAGPAAASVGN